MNGLKTLYVTSRKDWRAWLEKNFDIEKEVWLVYPKKASVSREFRIMML